MLLSILQVGLGGAIGAVCRVGLAELLKKRAANLPFATLLANILGCFLIGLLIGQHSNYVLFLCTGILGGFTTFSTFNRELFTYARFHQYHICLAYTLLTWCSCLLAACCGILLP